VADANEISLMTQRNLNHDMHNKSSVILITFHHKKLLRDMQIISA